MKIIVLLLLVLLSSLFAQYEVVVKQPRFTFIKSAVMPGWGEYSFGEKQRALGFFKREGLIWLTFFGSITVQSWYKSEYEGYAILHAGVDLSDKSSQFAVDIGNYDTFEEFNDAMGRTRSVDLKYPENDGFEWSWDSSVNRKIFDDIRMNHVSAKKFKSFTIGGLVVHRIISLIDVLYLKRKNSNLHLESSLLPQSYGNMTFVVTLTF